MMSLRNYTPLRLCVNPSKRLTWFLIILHVWAVIACITNDLNVLLQVVLSLLVAVHYKYVTRQSVETVIEHSETGWKYQSFEIMILPSTVISSMALFLHFKQDGKFKSLLIMNDALSAEDYRLLIVRLKTTLDYQV
ncbi:hypothetical protein DOJK_00655 [Patescibacteria group bacterium]|nr:hypothetical protein DOJK_00655 [Patescibacteria group bacterium]